MHLLIVSHTPHFPTDHGYAGWGPTVREIDHLATLFQSVVHVAPLHPGLAPDSAVPYSSANVTLRPVPPAGGNSWREKFGIFLRCPEYAATILREIRSADVVHIRAPANISLVGLILLSAVRQPKVRWAKYAGDWNRTGDEPWSYTFQRWWLRNGFHKGIVTVNGCWSNQPTHIYPFLNPCLTEEELSEGRRASLDKELCTPVRLLFVGRMVPGKGPGLCVDVLTQLIRGGVDAHLDLVGDGSAGLQCRDQARRSGVLDKVRFHGPLPRARIGEFYAQAHFILLPSETEGWPKVLSEAMAYGAVPIASAVSSIPQMLKNFALGEAVRTRDPNSFTHAVCSYVKKPARWREHSTRAVQTARVFSYAKYLAAVGQLLNLAPTQHSAGV